MCVVLIAHLSDSHLRESSDPLVRRSAALARVIESEAGSGLKGIVIAFTGDATDKGFVPGFKVAGQFLAALAGEVEGLTGCRPVMLAVPGNHDVVSPADPSLRDLAIASLSAPPVAAASTRPAAAIQAAVLAALDDYFTFAEGAAPGGSPGRGDPYYFVVDREFAGKLVRFHLINSSWMCTRGQGQGALVYPVDEIKPPPAEPAPDYEITLLHHPFNWFKQPEAMRPLRDRVEQISDMILTGHEHVGRGTREEVHGAAGYEYREGETLHEGQGDICGFHVLRLDFKAERQAFTTYRWRAGQDGSGGAFTRSVGPVESPLGRNLRRAALAYRLRPSFAERLEDPELPVLHPKQGKLGLSQFYVYPDLARVDEDVDGTRQRVKGDGVLEMVLKSPRVLLLGPDRCGKSSLSRRLCSDLHARGHAPLLVEGGRLKNATVERLGRLLEDLVEEQYEVIKAEEYWQGEPGKRVLILDDFHLGPADRRRREHLVSEIERRFGRTVVVAGDEFCFDELFSEAPGAGASALLAYEPYRILPFGHARCDRFVRNWVALGHSEGGDEFDGRVGLINGLLNQFLRNNPIPQYPWVVMIIVQHADSPEPLHARNGSYGYLLQALITAALAKSRLNLPVNGKYVWLGGLANELYSNDRKALTDAESRLFHERHRKDYGISQDYKEVRDDMVAAGVLRVEGGLVSFRQPYTYCYFVAWHLAQRLHGEDAGAIGDVRQLCGDLYHEDAANVLVFLAHLTTSPAVLSEMTAQASRLFSECAETDFVCDTAAINSLCGKGHALVLPPGAPSDNLAAMRDRMDGQRAEHEASTPPRREIVLRSERGGSLMKPGSEQQRSIEIVTAMRAIEILGQVLRNEATARKVDALVDITDQVFRLGRRLLGFIFAIASERLDRTITVLEGHYRQRMPEAEPGELTGEASRHLFNMYAFATFAVVKHTALAVSEKNLAEVFRRLVEKDANLANRIYKVAIDLEGGGGQIPLQDLEALSDELSGRAKTQGGGGRRSRNNIARTLVCALAIDHLHLNYVPHSQVQQLCAKLQINLPVSTNNLATKRLPPPK